MFLFSNNAVIHFGKLLIELRLAISFVVVNVSMTLIKGLGYLDY